jgi:hypothetical protein
MSTPNTAQLAIGLGGIQGGGQALQNAIKAELLGVDLATFGSGQGSAEAVARKDPGASSATLTFVKSGQSMPLPLDLAKALIGQASGSAQVSVDIIARSPDGGLSANIRRVGSVTSTPLPDAIKAALGSTSFSNAGHALAAAALASPSNSGSWISSIKMLTSGESLANLAVTQSIQENILSEQDALSFGKASASTSGSTLNANTLDASAKSLVDIARHFETALSKLASGAGVGYERALARLSTMGPEMAQSALDNLSRFPQATASNDLSGVLLAQQAKAQELGQIQWTGKAWQGASMGLAWGVGDASTPEADDTHERCGQKKSESVAWLRMRIEPEGLGPIDVWAVLLGGGRCQARLRAGPRALAYIEQAKRAFEPLLEAARVDLSLSSESESRHGT